jgi:transglutaminase-like putative cysteine protease
LTQHSDHIDRLRRQAIAWPAAELPTATMGKFKRLLDFVDWRHERPVDLAIAMMVVIATMILGASYHAPLVVWSTLLLVLSSIYLNDVTGWLRLNRKWASWLSLAAVVIWCVEARRLQGDWQLVAITYVLLILQIILLFQAKTDRIAWQVILLSVSQVAVAAGLSPGLWFGPLLILYTLVGLGAIAQLGMERQLTIAGASTAPQGDPAPVMFPAPQAAAAAVGGLSAAGSLPLRFVTEPVVWSRQHWRRALARQIAGMTCVTLVLTLIVFLLFPRAEQRREEMFEDLLRTVGYSHEVTLGDEVGQALQDPGDVLRIRFFEEPGHVPLQLASEPLLRGSVATDYSQGHWRQPQRGRGSEYLPRTTRPLKPLLAEHYVRQRITIEPRDDHTLFGIFPAGAVPGSSDDGVVMDDLGGELLRAVRYQWRRFDYELGTIAIQNGRQMPLVPADDFEAEGSSDDHPDQYLLAMPEKLPDGTDPLAGLRATAETVRQQAQLEPNQHFEIAQALAGYLRASGDFQYSELGQKRTAGVDPLEDFVTAHRRGHCEYFAGALALMLRSQGIPARVAIGYRAGEWNSAGGYYHVRQLHAHAWVEALLEPAHYADQDRFEGLDGDRAWLTLDATPSGQGAAGDNLSRGLWGRAWMYVDYLQVLWGRFVAGLNYATQQEAIYQPLATLFARGWEQLRSLYDWVGLPPISELGLIGRSWTWYRRHWFTFLGGLSTCAVLFGAAGAALLAMRMIRQLRRLARRATPHAGPRASSSEIYGRLERVLAHHGYRRANGQTPYEFALAAGGDLAERAGCSPLAALPRRVVEAFYRVRFGRHPLDSAEAQAVEHALSALERGLGHASGRG